MSIAYNTFNVEEFCRAETVDEMWGKLRESGDICKVWSYREVKEAE